MLRQRTNCKTTINHNQKEIQVPRKEPPPKIDPLIPQEEFYRKLQNIKYVAAQKPRQ